MKNQKQRRKVETIGNFKYDLTDEQVEIKEKYTKEVLSKKKKYKVLGGKLIKKELFNKWNSIVNKYFSTKESVWYNGVVFEATLMCMSSLSKKAPVEEAYRIIDIQNLEMPPVILGMKLTGYQNYLVSSLILEYHKRGQEFYDYRSSFIRKPHYNKNKSLSLKLK